MIGVFLAVFIIFFVLSQRKRIEAVLPLALSTYLFPHTRRGDANSLVFMLGRAIAALVIVLGLLHPAIRAVD